MSADNRILCHLVDGKWYAWHASASVNYVKPPKGEQTHVFESEDLLAKWCREEEKNTYLEYGIQELTQHEIIQGLKDQIEMLKDPLYCPDCGACGEDPCCSGAMCKRNRCLYGDSYAKEYTYFKLMTNKLYEALSKIDAELAKSVLDKCHDEAFAPKNSV